MAIREEIDAAFKRAMKEKDALRVSTLRLIRAALAERDIAARGAEDGGGVDDADIMALLTKMIKQREESARLYEEGGRVELSERERDEVTIIREFLPTPLSEGETGVAIEQAIEATGATSLKDMGAVMAHLRAQYLGRIDFSAAGKEVKAALSGKPPA